MDQSIALLNINAVLIHNGVHSLAQSVRIDEVEYLPLQCNYPSEHGHSMKVMSPSNLLLGKMISNWRGKQKPNYGIEKLGRPSHECLTRDWSARAGPITRLRRWFFSSSAMGRKEKAKRTDIQQERRKKKKKEKEKENGCPPWVPAVLSLSFSRRRHQSLPPVKRPNTTGRTARRIC